MNSMHRLATASLGSLIAIAVLVGLSVPGIYDWTGQDQSYHSPRTTWLMIGIPVIAIAFSLWMIWWPKSDDSKPPLRFNLRLLLVLTALIAVSLAIVPILPLIPSVAFCVAGYGYALWLARDARHRLAVISFLGCALAPFVWVACFNHPWDTNPLVAGALPAFLPSMITASLLPGVTLHNTPQLPAVLTGLQFITCLSIVRLGGRWAVAVITWTLVCSVFGSLVLHAMIRA